MFVSLFLFYVVNSIMSLFDRYVLCHQSCFIACLGAFGSFHFSEGDKTGYKITTTTTCAFGVQTATLLYMFVCMCNF